VATTIRLYLDRHLEGQTILVDVSCPSKIQVQLMAADGVPRLRRELSVTKEAVRGLTLMLTDIDVGTIKSSIPLPPPRAAIVSKTAVFVVVGGKSAEKAITLTKARLLLLQLIKETVALLKTMGGNRPGFLKSWDMVTPTQQPLPSAQTTGFTMDRDIVDS
jgi:hypothetical protein